MTGKPFAKRVLTTTAIVTGLCFGVFAQQNNNLKNVNPFIGTSKSNVLTKWGSEGGTYPGAVAPSGAIQLTPETRTNSGSRGYNYADSAIYYFSCFGHHSGYPEGSSGQFFVMPVAGSPNLEFGKYKRPFSHRNETAEPGYYKVVFDDDQTTAEATASTRAGIFRFTFKAAVIPQLFISGSGEITEVSGRILHSSNSNTVINFSESYTGKKKVEGGWLFTFGTGSSGDKIISLVISTSTIDFAGAQNNINQEIGSMGFDRLRERTKQEWAQQLAKVSITDNSQQNKTIFYTALYHSLIVPWVIDDADGRYRGADRKVYVKSGSNEYGGFSPWDTFRSLNPLLTLLYPGKEKDIILSMLDVYKQTGHLPVESMTGNHSVPIIVDSYLKGITGFDKELAYKAMKSNITGPLFVQKDMPIYHTNGYVPFTSSESVTRTVEYAYDDWALSQYAEKIMHNAADHQELLNRSFSYRNLLNPDELFFLPRNGSQFKLQPGMSGYKEGDKWVYTYFVPQNTKDLINLLGGNEQFVARLDSALSDNVILFDNETVFHLPYLFSQAGRPDLTQKWCREIMQGHFSNTPGGLPGNDDMGSTSSWYVLSAMGIYPVSPGRPLYAIGAPMFHSITLHLADKKEFVINATNSSPKNNYIQFLSVNGKPWHELTISHSLLMNGGGMNFAMGSKSDQWSVNKNPLELSETKSSPNFKVLSFESSKTTVTPDEQFTVRFSVSNSGSIGVKTFRLLVNGKTYAYKNCLVGLGETIKDSIQCRLYVLGNATLNLKGANPLVVSVVQPKVSVLRPFKISGLSMIPLIRVNTIQQISYSVQNVTGTKRIFQIPLFIRDTTFYTDTVTLEPGEKKMVKHAFADSVIGFRHVRVEDAKSDYKVYRENTAALLFDLSPGNVSKDTLPDQSGFGNNGHVMPQGVDHLLNKDHQLIFGEHDFVEVPNAPSLDKMGETITMMAWVYPTGSELGLVDVFTKGDSHVLQVFDGKTLTFFAGGWGRGDCTVNLPNDWKQHWHHIAGVCTGNTLFLYIDGELKGTTVMEDVVNLSNSNKWTLGRNEEFPSERVYHGYINRAKVFEEALSQSEIIELFKKEQIDHLSH